ncbi:hypothetical protein RclHR1_09190001 [Rhizophagus clarus]|uniref:TRP C-terminal domain-containing protein n=1 Tax=Rhizophagus clarus TaxID=94130 RepID=A0A2Z6SDX3_9GLOM|nr:hypothetical protein RclHR1_09190001 [Rhizophagus clarus]
MKIIQSFWLLLFAITLLAFQVDQTLSAGPLSVDDDYEGLVTFTGKDVFTAVKLAQRTLRKIAVLDYEWNTIEGDNSALTFFVIDDKNLMEHPECIIVENCNFFPYPDASCIGNCGASGKKSFNSNLPKQKIMLAIVKANFDSSLILNITIAFDAPENTPKLPGPSKSYDNELTTPTVTPHPENLLNGDITPDGYANCGTINFNDFRVWYTKEKNNIEFYLEGISDENLQSQAKFIVYFDAEHVVYENFPVQFNGPFKYRNEFSTNFDDIFPDSLFNVPGTGSYAVLTFQDANNQGCVTAPIGSQSTAYSNGITGISMTIALAFILLSAASLLFLKREVNYSIYPKKWVSIGEGITDVGRTADDNINRNIPPLFPISTTTIVSQNSSLIQTPSIYDLISVAQWIVTIALLTLPNLPVGYRQFASNFGWSTGTGGGINVQAFSNAASNLRELVCPLLSDVCTSSLNQFDTCQSWFNSDVTPEHLFTASITNGDKTYFPDPTGFESYSNTLHIPNSNIFFVMFVALLLAIGVALIIMLLIGIVAFTMKEKLKFLEKVNKNMRFLVFVLSTFQTDAELLWNDKYKILFGVLYTDYLKDRVWFVIPTTVYQFLRSLIVAIGHNSGIAQITCLVILELAHLITVYYFKPFERNLANIFNITLSTGRLIVLFLLTSFLGGNVTITPTTRFSLAIVLIILQLLMAVCVGGLILLNILCAAFKFLFKKDVKTDESTDINQAQEADEDNNNLSINEKIVD